MRSLKALRRLTLDLPRRWQLPQNSFIEQISDFNKEPRFSDWRQIQANVYRQKVEVLEADEGSAFGAAILAGVGANVWKTVDEACEKTIRVAETVEPNADSVEVLNRNYAAYKLLYSALSSAIKIIKEN